MPRLSSKIMIIYCQAHKPLTNLLNKTKAAACSLEIDRNHEKYHNVHVCAYVWLSIKESQHYLNTTIRTVTEDKNLVVPRLMKFG
jgi:hypothetical protein